MGFTIAAYDQTYLEGVIAVYNAETACEPHIAPLTSNRFLELVAAKSYFDPAGLLIAVARGEVVGWVHACAAAGTEPWHDQAKLVAAIRVLICPKDRLDIAHALVADATGWLRGKAGDELEAGSCRSGYPFYRGLWMGGEPMTPATMPHVHVALEVGGYKLNAQSIFMVAEMLSPPAEARPALAVELVESPAEMKHETMRESWIGFQPMRIRALRGGEEVGGIGWALLPHVSDRLGAPCANIWALGVKEEHRRKGIASLLVSRALGRGYGLGARFGSVATQLWNAPAQVTYSKFRFAPYCLLAERVLKRDQEADSREEAAERRSDADG